MSRQRYSKKFTTAQLRQHKQLGDRLQITNVFAAQALLTLRRLRPGGKQCENVYATLVHIVRQMDFLIASCEQLATSGFRPQVSRINVILGTTCGHCEETGRSAKRSSGRENLGSLEADPAWGILVENLLVQATLAIQGTVGSKCFSSSDCEGPRCLQNLTKTLLRQQRYLARMGGARIPEIAVMYDDAEVCPECGNPYASEPLVDDEDTSSPGIAAKKLA